VDREALAFGSGLSCLSARDAVVARGALDGLDLLRVRVLLGRRDRAESGLAAEGKKLTFIHAGKYKVEGNSAEPLSDEARATIQAMVDQAYGVMVKSIARNRGVSPEAVRSGYGEGRMFSADDALARGMVDRVATLEDTIARMANPRRRSRLAAANNAVRIAAL